MLHEENKVWILTEDDVKSDECWMKNELQIPTEDDAKSEECWMRKMSCKFRLKIMIRARNVEWENEVWILTEDDA